jgi:hypothetical protein
MSRLLASHPEADSDGDGKLSREEVKALQMNRKAASSGSPVAHVNWMLANFQKLDADGNGQLTVAELQSFQRQTAPEPDGGTKRHRDKAAPPNPDREGKKNREPKKAKAKGAQPTN